MISELLAARRRVLVTAAVAVLLTCAARAQLISETFTSGASNFTVVSGGTWSVTSGKYVLTNPANGAAGSGNGNISVHNTSVTTDFTLTVDGSTTATNAKWNDFSVIFNYQNSTNYYYVSFNESNDGGTSGIFKLVSGVQTQLADITTLITAGTTYAVKIERTGSTYKAYLNNTLVATATDTTFTSGKVGFGTLNDGASYDNLVVTVPQAAAPTFSPAGGTYTTAQSVTISTATSGASIRYTTDGSTPTSTTGTVYSSPVSISTTTTLKAVAYKSGMADSTVTTDTYTINNGTTITPSTGFYNAPLAAAQNGTFTVEWDVVPSLSPLDAVVSLSQGNVTGYTGMATIARFNSSGNIDARNGGAYAAASTIPYSANVSYHFRMVIDVQAHTYSIYVRPAGGSEATVGLNYAFRTEQAGVTALDTWNAAVNATPGGSIVVSNMAITSSQVAAPTFTPPGGTYTGAQSVTIATATSGASIRYTTDGSTPTSTSGTVYSGAITISANTTLKAIAYKSGMTDSTVTTETYTINSSTGNNYYVDPATGSMSNPGTSSSPWSTLEAVFAAGKTFAAGDTIFLRSGYHGAPVVSGNNSGDVTIKAQSGHTPLARKLTFSNAANWVVMDMDISPLHAGSTAYDTGTHVSVAGTSSDIAVMNCRVRSVFSVAGWLDTDWPTRTGKAFQVSGPRSSIIGNIIENVKWGVDVSKGAVNSLIRYNSITNIMSDGFRGLANDCTFEYNTLRNMYAIDGNHDDAFQSWSTDSSGTVGAGTVYRVVVRGNTFISYTDPNQPYKSAMQGIGCFDGMFEDWVVENNLVVTDQWHGLSFYGAVNCKIANNTVVKNPINARTNTPWIQIFNHKNGTPSTGNSVRNNLGSDINSGANGTWSNNIQTTAYDDFFVNYAGFDFHLKSTAPAVGAGTTTDAPSTDLEEKPRTVPYDVGAYEL